MKGKGTAKGGWRDAARRVAVATGVALCVTVVGSRVNRVEVDYSADPPVEGVLSRRVGAAEVDAGSWGSAAEGLSRAFGVRVEVLPGKEATLRAGGEAPLGGVVRLRDATLAEALARVLDRVETFPGAASFLVEGGMVYLGNALAVKNREPLVVRAYWVGDLVTRAEDWIGHSSGSRQEAEDDLARAPQGTVMPTAWDGGGGLFSPPQSGPRWGIRPLGDWVLVSSSASGQRAVQRTLFVLRHPAGPREQKEARR